MKKLYAIRETLQYVQRFRESVMLIKLGGKIIGQVIELGIIKDILLLKRVGLNIVLVHSSNNADDNQWENPECSFQRLDIGAIAEVDRYLSRGIIPVIRCFHAKDISDDKAAAILSGKLTSKKLIYITNREGIFNTEKQLIREVSINEAKKLVDNKAVTGGMKEKLKSAIKACELGVHRVHIISGFREGSLLNEVFSCDGVGTMVYNATPYTNIRKAKPEEIGSIIDILKSSLTTPVIYANIVSKIKNFYVFTVDEQIHGCVMMEENLKSGTAKLNYTATSLSYEDSNAIKKLMEYIFQKTISRKIKKIILEPEKNSIWLGMYPWFSKLGFKKKSSAELKSRKKIWIKAVN